MSRRLRLGSILAVAAIVGGSTADGQDLRLVDFKERVGPKQTSGGDLAVRGIMLGDLGMTIERPVIYVHGLASGDKQLCVHVEQINGAYSADLRAEYDAKRTTNGPARLDFGKNTKNFDRIKGLNANAVAVSVRAQSKRGTCGRSLPFLPASWTPDAAIPVTALILSPQARASIVNPLKLTDGRCVVVGEGQRFEGQRTSYDTACSFDPRTHCGGTIEWRIRRIETTGSLLEPVAATVRIPC